MSAEDAATTAPNINVFVSSVSANKEIRRKQLGLLQVLEIKRIVFVKRDIAVSDDDKALYRRLMKRVNNTAAMPPQIFYDEQYCGDYDAFYEAVDEDRLYEFLRLERPDKPSADEEQTSEVPTTPETVCNEEVQTTVAVAAELRFAAT